MATVFDQIHQEAQRNGNVFAQIHQESQQSPKGEDPGFFSEVWNRTLGQIPAGIHEFLNRPQAIRDAAEAAIVGLKARAEKRSLTPEEQTIFDKGAAAPINSPISPVGAGELEPAIAAGVHARAGNLPAAAGALVGGYGPYVAAPLAEGAAEGVSNAASRAKAVVQTPGVMRTAAEIIPKGKAMLATLDKIKAAREALAANSPEALAMAKQNAFIEQIMGKPIDKLTPVELEQGQAIAARIQNGVSEQGRPGPRPGKVEAFSPEEKAMQPQKPLAEQLREELQAGRQPEPEPITSSKPNGVLEPGGAGAPLRPPISPTPAFIEPAAAPPKRPLPFPKRQDFTNGPSSTLADAAQSPATTAVTPSAPATEASTLAEATAPKVLTMPATNEARLAAAKEAKIAGNRAAMAGRFADAISQGSLTAKDLSQFEESHWKTLADAIGEKLPSAETQKAIIAKIKAAEAARQAPTALNTPAKLAAAKSLQEAQTPR